jgi:hypothetical protein
MVFIHTLQQVGRAVRLGVGPGVGLDVALGIGVTLDLGHLIIEYLVGPITVDPPARRTTLER